MEMDGNDDRTNGKRGGTRKGKNAVEKKTNWMHGSLREENSIVPKRNEWNCRFLSVAMPAIIAGP